MPDLLRWCEIAGNGQGWDWQLQEGKNLRGFHHHWPPTGSRFLKDSDRDQRMMRAQTPSCNGVTYNTVNVGGIFTEQSGSGSENFERGNRPRQQAGSINSLCVWRFCLVWVCCSELSLGTCHTGVETSWRHMGSRHWEQFCGTESTQDTAEYLLLKWPQTSSLGSTRREHQSRDNRYCGGLFPHSVSACVCFRGTVNLTAGYRRWVQMPSPSRLFVKHWKSGRSNQSGIPCEVWVTREKCTYFPNIPLVTSLLNVRSLNLGLILSQILLFPPLIQEIRWSASRQFTFSLVKPPM